MRYNTRNLRSDRIRLALCGWLIAGILLLDAGVAQSQVMTLDSVLARVEQYNPALQAYESRATAMAEYATGARSWMAPMVGVGPYMLPYSSRSGEGAAENGSWMFTLEQEIPNPAKQRASQRYMESRASIEEYGRDAHLNQLRSEAKTYYFRWLVAEEKLSVLSENEKIMQLMHKLAELRYPYNQGSLGNIYKAEGRLAQIRNEKLKVHSDIRSLETGLKTVMALEMSDTIMIDTATVVVFEHGVVAYDTADLASARSDIRQIDAQIETMRLNQRLQRTNAKPDFRIRLDHMESVGNMPPQYSAMAMVTIPIAPWSSKKYKSEVRAVEHEIDAIKHNKASALLEARGRLVQMSERITRTQQQLENYEAKIIPALRKNYQTLMLAYEENREQLPIVIDAWEAMNLAQMDYLMKKEEYYTMIVDYERELEK